MKDPEFPTITKSSKCFDAKLEKINKLSVDPMTTSLAIGFPKTEISGNDQLLYTWVLCDTIRESADTGVATTYQDYYDFFMSTAEKLEDSIINNSSSLKVNVVKTDFLEPYTPADDHYTEAIDLSLYMGAQGTDVDMIHGFLNCKKTLQQGKPCQKDRARRSPREHICCKL